MNEQEEKKEPEEKNDAPKGEGPSWEAELDVYPLREAAEDPRWAVRTVWVWVGVALASLVFILTLLVLGAIYD